MPNYHATGIVIGRTNFGEADRVIRLITPDHGKLSAVAKGVRKIKSRTSGHLEPFSLTNLVLATGRNLDVVTSARLAWYPHSLTTSYDRVAFAYQIATSIDKLTEAGQPQPALFNVVKEALETLDSQGPGPMLELWYKLRLLDCLGYRPELNGCVVCGTHSTETTYVFDVNRGGIVCHADSLPGSPDMELAAIKQWRLLSDYPYATIGRMKDGTAVAATTLPLADLFYQEHLGYRFETATF